jgi:hypothetical protein
MLARRTGAAWIVAAIDDDPSGVGRSTAIALDAAGTAHVSYQDIGRADIKYARVAGVTSVGTGGAAGTIELAIVPNPAGRGGAEATFRLPAGAIGRLAVFDPSGRRVATIDGAISAGAGTLRWDARDAEGSPVAPGVYFLRLDAGNASVTRRLVVVR